MRAAFAVALGIALGAAGSGAVVARTARDSGVVCGEAVAGEPIFGGATPTYDWCRAVVDGVRVFFGGDPIDSITLTRYPEESP